MKCIRLILLALLPATSLLAQSATTQSSEVPGPTRVTLKLDHVPAIDAFNQLFAQAGVVPDNVKRQPELERQLRDAKVTTNLVDEPYLLALLELCKQANV